MNKILEIQELAIVVVAKKHNPTILSLDFLKSSGIVPIDWEVARQPIYTNQAAQVTFQNGVSLVAQLDRIVFSESIGDKNDQDVKMPEIVHKYVAALPHADYQAVGVNLIGHVPFNNEADAARKYLTETLLSPGPWHEIGQAPVKATVDFVYTLERSRLNLSVSEAALQLPEKTSIPIVLFSGNFNYDISENTVEEQLYDLQQVVGNWKDDLKTYREVVNQHFLAKATDTVVAAPDLFSMSVFPEPDVLKAL